MASCSMRCAVQGVPCSMRTMVWPARALLDQKPRTPAAHQPRTQPLQHARQMLSYASMRDVAQLTTTTDVAVESTGTIQDGCVTNARERLNAWAHRAAPYVPAEKTSNTTPIPLVFVGRGMSAKAAAAAASRQANAANASSGQASEIRGEQLATRVAGLSEEAALTADRNVAFLEARAGVPAAARVLAAHLEMLQDGKFVEAWEFCAGLHGGGEDGDARVAAMLLGASSGPRAFARLMRIGPFEAGRTMLWLRQELGAGEVEVVSRLMPIYPELLGSTAEELEQAVAELEGLGLFCSRQEMRRLLADCPALLLPGVYEDTLGILQRVARSRANKYVASGSYHI